MTAVLRHRDGLHLRRKLRIGCDAAVEVVMSFPLSRSSSHDVSVHCGPIVPIRAGRRGYVLNLFLAAPEPEASSG